MILSLGGWGAVLLMFLALLISPGFIHPGFIGLFPAKAPGPLGVQTAPPKEAVLCGPKLLITGLKIYLNLVVASGMSL